MAFRAPLLGYLPKDSLWAFAHQQTLNALQKKPCGWSNDVDHSAARSRARDLITGNSIARTSSARKRQRRRVAAVISSAILVIVIAVLRRSDRGQSMNGASFRRRNENTIEGRVTIKRPVEKVFEFYRNFKNLPSFLGDVWELTRLVRELP